MEGTPILTKNQPWKKKLSHPPPNFSFSFKTKIDFLQKGNNRLELEFSLSQNVVN